MDEVPTSDPVFTASIAHDLFHRGQLHVFLNLVSLVISYKELLANVAYDLKEKYNMTPLLFVFSKTSLIRI